MGVRSAPERGQCRWQAGGVRPQAGRPCRAEQIREGIATDRLTIEQSLEVRAGLALGMESHLILFSAGPA